MHLDLSRGMNIFRTDRKKKEIRKLSGQFREINNCGLMKINVLTAESVEMGLKWQKVSIFFTFLIQLVNPCEVMFSSWISMMFMISRSFVTNRQLLKIWWTTRGLTSCSFYHELSYT